jgi:hypothetical protein
MRSTAKRTTTGSTTAIGSRATSAPAAEATATMAALAHQEVT